MRRSLTVPHGGFDDRSAGVRRFRHRRGAVLSASVTRALIRDWDENPHHFLVMLESITEAKATAG